MAAYSRIAPESRQRRHVRLSGAAVPLLTVCGLAIAGCMMLGNSTLWMTNDQATALATPDAPETPIEEMIPEPVDTDQEIIGSYTAISQSEEPGRAENIKLAAEELNGTIVAPGETFSFNDLIGDTSKDKRYKSSPVVSNGEVVTGVGGGICQVSTALYIAAVKADLEITERHPHSLVSDYAPIGLDATIAYGDYDLKITNNTDEPITILAEAVGQTVTVSIMGEPLEEGVSIDAVSRIVNRYDEKDSAGETHTYYVSESFRVYYKDGVKTGDELLSSDIYRIEDNSVVTLGEGSVDFNK